MANGLTMMLKSLGIDPEEIVREVKGTLDQYGAVLLALKQQMDRIEKDQKAIMDSLKIPAITPEQMPQGNGEKNG